MNRIVPVGTMGQAISLRASSLRTKARKVVKQIETPRSPDPIMRRPCADREEKRVTRGSEASDQGDQEQLDLNDPNQRRLLEIGDTGTRFSGSRCPRMAKTSKCCSPP